MNYTNCPNCGAPLDMATAKNGSVRCQYCDTALPVHTDEEQLQETAAEFIADTFGSAKRQELFTKVFFTVFISIFVIAFLFILFTMFSISRSFRFFGF